MYYFYAKAISKRTHSYSRFISLKWNKLNNLELELKVLIRKSLSLERGIASQDRISKLS